MAGGKKARGYAAKQKQHRNASPPIERNTAFITTPGGHERVFPPKVRNTIYRYLLLGRNVKKQRESELWNTKGWAEFYDFGVNILRVNKAVYAEGKRRTLHSNLHSKHAANLCRHLEQQEKSSMVRTPSLSCPARSTRSPSASSFMPFRLSLRTSLLSTASPSTVST